MDISADNYYISVDGGASKTEFCARNLATNKETYFFSGSTNFKNTGVDVEMNLLNGGLIRIMDTLKIKPEQVRGLVMGLAGCDSKKDCDYFASLAALTGIKGENTYICNDCEIAFFSEGKAPGLSVNAGTGSISTGVASDFKKARSGGWGSPIGDEGSGGWIGIHVIRDLLRYCDGYGEYRRIFDIIRLHMQKDSFDELPHTLSLYTIEEIAGFAKLVMDEAEEGDGFCATLTDRSAELVAEIAYSVYKKLNFSEESVVDVVMLGSLFKSGYYCEAFKKCLTEMAGKSNINFCGQARRPVTGGITVAYSMFSG